MAPEPRPHPTASSGRGVLLGAILWILSLEFFVGQAVAQAAWHAPYSMLTKIWATPPAEPGLPPASTWRAWD